MSVLHITNDSFKAEVLDQKGTVLIDFFATWCGPCKMLAPILEQVANDNPDVKVVKVDVDEEPELAQKFGIMSIPTLVVFKDGQAISQNVGGRSKAQIEELIR